MNARSATASIVLLALAACGSAKAGPEPTQPGGSQRAVAVYALSKGKGVPSATRDVLKKARALLEDLQREHKVARVEQTPIGLEGETRLCAEFADEPTARETIEKLRAMSRGVELLNVVEEPCRRSE